MLESLRSSPSLKQTILTLNMYTTSRFILKVICIRIHIKTATQSMAIIHIPARRIRPAPTSYTGTVHLSSPESRWAPNPETEGLRSSIATQSHQQALHGKAVPLSINTATEEFLWVTDRGAPGVQIGPSRGLRVFPQASSLKPPSGTSFQHSMVRCQAKTSIAKCYS